jgi:tRNA threonylcarbamoyladenosine biosynthesis protein TsaE
LTKPEHRRTWETTSADETFALGEVIGRSLVGGLVVGLCGSLGAGKTHLVKGIAAGNAVDDIRGVTSPTFTLIHEYPGRLTLYHVDVYRLGGPHELVALGFDELLRPDTVVVVEWADRVRPVIPPGRLWVEFEITGDEMRSLAFTAAGKMAGRVLDGLRAAYR